MNKLIKSHHYGFRAFRVKCYYMFEFAGELINLPPLPFSFDLQRKQEPAHKNLFTPKMGKWT
jgi:hypothetical protein